MNSEIVPILQDFFACGTIVCAFMVLWTMMELHLFKIRYSERWCEHQRAMNKLQRWLSSHPSSNIYHPVAQGHLLEAIAPLNIYAYLTRDVDTAIEVTYLLSFYDYEPTTCTRKQ